MTVPARRPTRRRWGALAVLAALVVVLASCSSSDDGDASASSSTTGASGDFAPVTVAHKFGETAIDTRPERIVTLDTQWTDVLLAMDEVPVGYLEDPNAPEGFPWRGDQLADSTPIEATDAIPVEQVAALDPDLIVTSWQVEDQAVYDQLSQIAPTVTLLSDRQVDRWQDMIAVAGQVLGDSARADQVVADVEAQVAATAEAHPGLQGKTFVLANYVPGDNIYVVADPEDGSTALFEELGMSIAPTILEAADDVTGRATLSLENISLLDGDLLVMLPNGADPASIPGYDQLPAVQSGAVVLMDFADVVGLNTPTPLSIPYELELLEPALTTAAG